LDATIHNSLGVLFVGKGDLNGAIYEFRTAVALSPNDADGHNNLGLALQSKGDIDQSITEYRTALRLDPNNARAHFKMGKALQVQEKNADAKGNFLSFYD
jgi:Flp pilus assembly protein TadD